HRRSRSDSRRHRARNAQQASRTHRRPSRRHFTRVGDGHVRRRDRARRQRPRDVSDSRDDQAAVRREGDRARADERGGATRDAVSTAPAAVAKSTFWSWDRVADALESLSRGNLARGVATFGRVWTDTRTIEPGDLFVALVGERFDAHDFLAEAVAKGAAGLVVSRTDTAKGLGVPIFE